MGTKANCKLKNNLMHSLIYLIISLFLLPSICSAGWYMTKVSNVQAPAKYYSVYVGDGRNTGRFNIYGANKDYHVYEYYWTGNSFSSPIDMGYGNGAMYCVTVGSVTNSNSRVYAANGDGKIYEFRWDTSENRWNFANLGNPPPNAGAMNCVTVGPGRSYGVNRVYAGNNNGRIYEYTYTGTWSRSSLPQSLYLGAVKGVCVGIGRNDNTYRVYSACSDGYVYEYTYSNGVWETGTIGVSNKSLERITIGKGHNDVKNYLYVASSDGHVWEVEYVGDTTWNARTIITSEKMDSFSEVIVCDGRNDGINRVYAVSVDSHVYEATYRGDNSWDVVIIGTCTQPLSAIHYGNARNDGINRLYVACDDKYIYELYYDSIVPTSVVQFPKDGKYYQNVPTISGTAEDNIGLSKVELQIYYLENNTTYYWNGNKWVTSPVGNTAVDLESWYYTNNVSWETGKEYYVIPYATDISVPPNVENASLKAPVKFTFDNTPPPQVTDLHASPGRTEGEVKLTWTAPGNDTNTNRGLIAGKYTIKYSTNATDEWQSSSSIVITTSSAKGATEIIYIGGLELGVTYYFWLKTEDEAGNISEISNQAQSRPYVPPISQPQNFNVTDLEVGRKLHLFWKLNPESQLAGYEIYRSTYSSPITEKRLIASVATPLTYYIDSGLSDHVTYYYQITAVDRYGNKSSPSEEAYAYPTDKLPPEVPAEFIAVAGDKVIALYWKLNSEEDVFQYLIERSLTGEEGSFGYIKAVQHPIDYYYDGNLTNGTTYYYRMRAEDYSGNKSGYTSVVSTTPYSGGDVFPPAAVSDLKAYPGSSEGEIILSWTSVGDDGYSGNITNGKYVIKYTTNVNATWSTQENYQLEITTNTTPGRRESTTITALTGGVTYYFWIRTYDDIGNVSPLSNRATSYAQIDRTPPAEITDLSATPGSNEGEIILTWTSPGDDGPTGILKEGSMFKIQYSTSPQDTIWSIENAQITISTYNISPGTQLSYPVKDLEPTWKYYFYIWTRDDNYNFSKMSNEASSYPQQDTIAPAKITTLKVALVGGTSVYLSWAATGDNGNEGIIKVGTYWIKYSSSPIDESMWDKIPYEVIWTTYNVTPGEIQTKEIIGLLSDTLYYFAIKVRDETPNNWSPMSVVVSTITRDIIPPGRITNLSAVPGEKEGDIILSWISPGDNGYNKNLVNGAFIVKYTTNTLDASLFWGNAENAIVISTTAILNTRQQLVIPGLIPINTYYFAIRVKDSAGNISELSDIVSGQPRLYVPWKITMELPQEIRAGEGGRIRITVYNEKNEGAIGYTGTIRFLTNAPEALLPQSYTFTAEDKGMKEFMFIMYTAGKPYIKVEDINNSKLSAQKDITVRPLPASQLILSGIPNVVAAGTKLTLTVEAQDAFGNIDTSYTRRITFYTNDENAIISTQSYTFTLNDGGRKEFPGLVTFHSTGKKRIACTDSTGIEGELYTDVYALFTFKLFVETDKKEVRAGEPLSVKVTVLDPFNNPYTIYQGSVAFTATADPKAVLPSTSSLLNGYKEFTNAVKFYTAGAQEIRVYDIVERRLTGSAYVNVLPEEIVKFTVEVFSEEDGKRVYNKIYADKPAKIKIKAVDKYNNVVAQFNGKVKLSITSGKIYPEETKVFKDGIYEDTIYVEYANLGTVKITCEAASIKGESEPITVIPSDITYKSICYPNPFNPLEKPLTIRFYLKKPGEVTIRIYDLSGSLVSTIRTSGAEGINYTLWDGKNEYGNVVASGGYIGLVEKRYYDNSVERERVMIAVIK